jgi:hypothetical protein
VFVVVYPSDSKSCADGITSRRDKPASQAGYARRQRASEAGLMEETTPILRDLPNCHRATLTVLGVLQGMSEGDSKFSFGHCATGSRDPGTFHNAMAATEVMPTTSGGPALVKSWRRC